MSPSVDFLSTSNKPFVPVSIPREAGDGLRDSPSPSPLSPTCGVYYNARLDPKNFLNGPLSLNPATRVRQMLARPGIIVSVFLHDEDVCSAVDRLPREFATASARAVLLRLVSTACTRGPPRHRKPWKPKSLYSSLFSGAATTASRLGAPDLAIATLNDFVGVCTARFNLCVSGLTGQC